jgi:hypothetical protein
MGKTKTTERIKEFIIYIILINYIIVLYTFSTMSAPVNCVASEPELVVSKFFPAHLITNAILHLNGKQNTIYHYCSIFVKDNSVLGSWIKSLNF